MSNKALTQTKYSSVKKIAGIKIQDNGLFTRPDDIYDVQVSDFIIEIDRDFLSQLTNQDASNIIKEGTEYCKEQLKASGLKIMGSHMRSNPPNDEPHIVVSVLYDERLYAVIDIINKVTTE